GSSSARWCHSSTLRVPSSARSIKRLFERGLADAAIGLGKMLAVLTQLQIDIDQLVDRGGNVVAFHGRTDDRADRGFPAGIAAERDLIDLLAVLIDPEDADMAEMVMAAGVDATGYLDVEGADRVFLRRHIFGDPLRHRDRAGGGEAAIIEPRAADDAGDLVDVTGAQLGGIEPLPQPVERVTADVREDEVLVVGDAHVAEAQLVGEIGKKVHLVAAAIAGRLA